MVTLDIVGIIQDFPGYRVAVVAAQDLVIRTERTAALEQELSETELGIARALGAKPLAEVPEIKRWREAYKRFGVKKTSYRSSVERLLKAIQQGRGLPRVNALVDAYNCVSALHCMPVGADDLDKVTGSLAFRYAISGDSFVRLGEESGAVDPPRAGEVVYADAEKVLCRRWNWHQDARSAISPASRRAVLTVQSLGPEAAVEQAAAEICRWLADHCAARTSWAVTDIDRPRVELALP